MTKRVLILCTGNSCRSQMAEGLWREIGRGDWEAYSAGSKPAGYVHPLALRVLQEAGIELANGESKHVERYLEEPFDVVVTVCDSARETCPVIPGAQETLHWPFPDPAHATGTEEEQLEVFRTVRDAIRRRITRYLSEAAVR